MVARGASPWQLNNAQESMESLANNHVLYSTLVKMPFDIMVTRGHSREEHRHVVQLQDITQQNPKWASVVKIF